jgi:hypothetical protein
MPLPANISTVTVSAGPYLDYAGKPVRGTLTFTSSATPLVWAATGTPLVSSAIKVELDQGRATVVLPATDQGGFKAQGVGIQDWTYTVSFDFIDAKSPKSVSIALPADAPNVDLDLLLPTYGSTGVYTNVRGVWSVNGQTGNIEIKVPRAPVALNPLDFGAVGDGTTDDTRAVQACLDAAMAVSGSSVEFPARSFRVSSVGIDYSKAKWPVQPESGEPFGYSSPTVRGQGSKKTRLIQIPGSTGDVFTVSGKIGSETGPANNNKATGARVEGMEIVGTSTGRNGLYLRSLVNSRFSDLVIRGNGRSGIYFARETFTQTDPRDDEYSYANSFHDVKTVENGEWGVACSGTTSIAASFYDVEASRNGVGGWFVAPTNMALYSCQAIGNGFGSFAARGLLAVRNTNPASVNSSLMLINFRSEGNGGVNAVEVELASGIGYTVINPSFYPTGGAHCLSLGDRNLGQDGYLQSPYVQGGYYGTNSTTWPTQKAIILGSDSRNAMVKGGRYNFTSITGTVDQLVDDRGFRSSIETPANVRFGANGVLSLMRDVTVAPGGRQGESQLFQRTNVDGKQEVVVKFSTGDPVVLATQA